MGDSPSVKDAGYSFHFARSSSDGSLERRTLHGPTSSFQSLP